MYGMDGPGRATYTRGCLSQMLQETLDKSALLSGEGTGRSQLRFRAILLSCQLRHKARADSQSFCEGRSGPWTKLPEN